MYEIAIEETWDPDLVESLNESVGYFINDEGLLDWDLTRVLDPTTVAASDAMGHDAALPDDIGSSRSGWRAAQDAQRRAIEAAIQKNERELAAAGVALTRAETAPVAAPQLTVPRSRPRSKNQNGCCIWSEAHLAELEAVKEHKEATAAKKVQRVDQFWERWRPAVRGAETSIESLGTPSKLKVCALKGLVVSRTGHCPKAKNNKPPACELLAEARAAIAASRSTMCPSTPEAGQRGDAGDDTSTEPVITCDCGVIQPEVHVQEDGMAFCIACEARVPSMDDEDDSDDSDDDDDDDGDDPRALKKRRERHRPRQRPRAREKNGGAGYAVVNTE